MSRQHLARQPLGWPIRCSFLVAAACLVGLLVVARKLEPDPRGFGTHTQLGLPAVCVPDRDGTAVPDLRHDHLVCVVDARADRSFLASQSRGVPVCPADCSA